MAVKLSDAAIAGGVRLVWNEVTGSTNTLAMQAAAAGEAGPIWFVAGAQETGRGRRERHWVSPPGNLYASLLLSDPAAPEKIAELCFVAALALDDALIALAPYALERIQLKWPNDVLVDGAKIAGILIEATTSGRATHAVIGMGVNVASCPAGQPYKVSSLEGCGLAISVEALFTQLSASMLRALEVWQRGDGFAAIRAGWIARAYGLGGPITVRTAEREIEGLFAGLDAEGQIVLQTPDGEKRIRVGEVFFAGS